MADTPQSTRPHRLRYRFSMRQLLVLMAVVAAVTVLVTNHFRAKEAGSRLSRFLLAVKAGNLADVDRLLKLDPRLAHQRDNGHTSSSHTPLQQALLFSNNPSVVERILKEKPDINQRSSHGSTVLHLVASYQNQMIGAALEFVQLGADINATDNDGATPLHIAVRNDQTGQMTKVLLDNGADPELPHVGREGQTALHMVVAWGRVATARQLLASGAAVSTRDAKGRTALHFALARNDLKMSQLLIAHGADLLAKDNDGLIPGQQKIGTTSDGANSSTAALLWWELIVKAHDERQLARLDAMLDATPEVLAFRSGELETTHLHRAVANMRLDIVEFLLKRGANVNAHGTEGIRPLHLAISPSVPPELITRLLAAGADINATTDHGQTPLHFAARAHSPAALRLLVERGADMSAVDAFGATALDVPFEREYHDDAKRIQALLVELGLPPTMLYAAATGDIELMKRLMNGDQKQLDREYTRNGIRPLHAAVLGRKIPAIEWLLSQGVDPNPHRPPGYQFSGLETPLMMAIGYQAIDVAVFLIEHGADVNLPGRSGHYPIHASIAWDRDPALLGTLLAHGADVSLRYQDKTAEDLANASNSKYRERYLDLLRGPTQSRR